MTHIFTTIYNTRLWGNGSGSGSYKKCTVNYLKFLNNFIERNNIKSVVDLGCGDWQMLRYFNFSSSIQYYGYDVVKKLVVSHNKTYKKENINFYYLNKLSDYIKEADLIMCKDVLQHWENDNIMFFLHNILPKYKFGIIVNDFKRDYENRNIDVGEWRPLNLENKPFYYNKFSTHYDMMFCNRIKRIYTKY